jgi:large subunit ribosomal protein L16
MMLLFPKNIKFPRSYSRRKRLFNAQHSSNIVLGNFALISLESGKINNKQLEGIRRVLRRMLKKQGKTWLRPFPNSSITKKADGVRMGKGKGNHKV